MASTARGRDPAVEEEFLGALYKGGELLAAGKIVEAREHLEKAHRLEPKNEKAQNLLGLCYFKLGLFDDAARVYELLVRENPVDPTLRVNLGLVYLKTNSLDRCIKELETATDLDPSHQKAHNYLGLALAQAGEYARAREHFHAAGSEAMAEKMTKALVARAEAAADDGPGMTVSSPPPATAQAKTNAPAAPLTVKIEEPPPPPEPPAPPVADTDPGTYDVMSDEEVPSDAYVVPEDAILPAPPPSGPKLDSDWGSHFSSEPPAPAPPPEDEEEMRFAEDEGPSSMAEGEAMPVLDASAVQVETTHLETTAIDASVAEAVGGEVTDTGIVEPVEEHVEPLPAEVSRVSTATPAWLTMEAAEAANGPGETQWVTEGLSDVPLPSTQPSVEAEVSWGEGQDAAAPQAEVWTHEQQPVAQPWEAAYAEGTAPAEAAYAAQYTETATYDGATYAESAAYSEAVYANTEGYAEASYAAATPASEYAASAEAMAAEARGYSEALPADDAANADAMPAEQSAYSEATPTDDPPTADAMPGAQRGSYDVAPADDAATAADAMPGEQSGSSDAAPADYAATAAADAMPGEQSGSYDATPADYAATADAMPSEQTGYAEAATPGYATSAEATGAAGYSETATPYGDGPSTEYAAPTDDASFDAAFADPAAGAGRGAPAEASAGPIPPIEMPAMPVAMDEIPAPNPSGPDLPIDVAPPIEASALPPEAAEVPAGYSAMRSQRLVDIGAASGWVREPNAGPFHMSSEGLAVTVDGEMLSRMTGLVAVVGGLDVKPEVRRKRGRPTGENFGVEATQLQRISGNGVLYLEPGRHRFFAVDLTDTNGASVDDDGAYLREEAVFAFEEPVAYENGRITGEGLAVDLVHLKGEGKALLQLEGAMKAMPIPPGAPMVVPLKRLVGWFGRVTPRLLGFGGQGAVELKGDGYALLETPGERA